MSDETTQTSEKATEEKASVKMVPESDLVTIKKSLTKDLENLKAESAAAVSEAKLEADKHYKGLLVERTAKEQLETQLKEVSEYKPKYEEAVAKVTQYEKDLPLWADRALQMQKDLVALKYGVAVDLMEGKTVQDLDTLDEALKIAGKGKAGRVYDTGSGTGTPSATPFKTEMDEMAEIKANKK
jgi:hypothetical protein